MVRTQVQLTEQQSRELREVAKRRGVSLAEVIRQAVDRELEEDRREAKWDRAIVLLGRFRDLDGSSDVAADHDRYLDEGYGSAAAPKDDRS